MRIKTPQSSIWKRVSMIAFLSLFTAGLATGWCAKADPIDPEAWYGRMRQPWAPQASGCIRDWLILGDFSKSQIQGNEEAVFDFDLLSDQRGEEQIQPSDGMTHQRPDGSSVSWISHQASENIIDLAALLGARPTDNTIAYAFTTVNRETAGSATLGIGSDDGIQIWVNGKPVHRHRVGRAVTIDDDRVEVNFEEGENTLLLKIENGSGGWGFACRILNNDVRSVLPQLNFGPSILSDLQADELVVQTDLIHDTRNSVDVEAVQAGGTILASQTVPRGDQASFATTNWPDGAYEIRCTLSLPFETDRVRHLPGFKGDAAVAVQQVLQAAQAIESDEEADMITTMLADLIRDRLGKGAETADDSDVLTVHSALMEYEELEQERDGQNARIRPHGYVRLAYRDPVDGSPQFGQVYLPPNYDPSKKWPLVLYLHGYNPDNPKYVKWWAIDSRHHNRAEDYGVIYLIPHGRGNTGYRGIGEQDVLRCIQMAKERFSIDEDRVLLSGESMGGGGTWHVGTRNPELFAAIAPVFGGWDYRVHMPDEEIEKLTPLERFQHDSWSSFAQTEALLTTPVFVNHGDADHLVDVENSRYIIRQLQRWRYNIRYGEQPGGGHFDSDHWPAIMEWLLEQERVSHPREVRIRSAKLKEAKAHWVRVEQQADPFAFMQVKAECVAPNAIRLDTDNVLAVTLSPGGELADPAKPLTVVWNETDIQTVPLVDGKATITSPDAMTGPLLKRPELAGPASDVQATPFAIVLGTASTNPLMQAFCEYHAKALVHQWEDWQKQSPRFFRDVDLTEADKQAYSLILVGGPEENTVTRELWESLPLRIDGDDIIVDGKSFVSPDAAVQLVYPHPLNSDRYVQVIAATSPQGMFRAFDLPREYDFAIQDGRTLPSGEEASGEDLRVVSGTFDSAWRLKDEFLLTGDPDIRASGQQIKPPAYIDTRVETHRLYLSDVLQTKAVQTFQNLRRDVNAKGEPLKLDGKVYEHGISVFPWSTAGSADWDLGDGNWQRLTATIGLELNPAEDFTEKDAGNTKVRFSVLGDGEELFRSEQFRVDTPPQAIDIPIVDVKTLTLVLHNEANWNQAVKSADWADIQLQQ
jgi:predicted esterase